MLLVAHFVLLHVIVVFTLLISVVWSYELKVLCPLEAHESHDRGS